MNLAGSLLKKGHFIDIFNILGLLYDAIDFSLRFNVWFYILLDFLWFTFQVFEDCGFFNNIIGKLFPFHISVSIDINFIKELGQKSFKGLVSIGHLGLPEFEVPFGDRNKLLQLQFAIIFFELLFEKGDCDFIKIQSHIGNHFFIVYFIIIKGSPGGINWNYVQQIFIFLWRWHSIILRKRNWD